MSKNKNPTPFNLNMRKLYENSGCTQKDFALKFGCSEQAMCCYLSEGNPSFGFIDSFHKVYEHISVHELLFGDIEDYIFSDSDDAMKLYFGDYYLLYLNTSKYDERENSEKDIFHSVEMRYGILHISSNNRVKSKEAQCEAFFNIKDRNTAKKMKELLGQGKETKEVLEAIGVDKKITFYQGFFNMYQQYTTISLTRKSGADDSLLIVLRQPRKLTKEYLGGLGTINSAACSDESDPIVQFIALSRGEMMFQDEEVKERLRFSLANINVKNNNMTEEIIRLTEKLYDLNTDDNPDDTTLSRDNAKLIITAYIQSLVESNVENNQLWYGRVSQHDDTRWYHMLTRTELKDKER